MPYFLTPSPSWRGPLLLAAALGVTLQLAQPPARASSGAPAREIVLDAAAAAAGDLPRLHSLLVSWRGTLVLERYFNGVRAARPANIKSAAKAVISALVGIAIDRGLLEGVSQPIAPFFPELKTIDRDGLKSRIRIEDLLSMRSGLESTSSRNYGAWVRSRNWVRYVLERPLVAAPGTVMWYSTGNTHLLSAILTKVSGTTTRRFAQEHLTTPLGFTLAEWPRDPQGIYFGGNEMLMTPRQMLAFGELYLNEGRVNGRQVVPESWVETSIVPRGRSDYSEQLHGYGWWIRELGGYDAFFAWGYGGQYIFIVRELDLVVVTTSSTAVGEERFNHRRTIFDLVERFVIEPIAAAD
jgi:CubicO group peptidase (beta-lactamase class C family)